MIATLIYATTAALTLAAVFVMVKATYAQQCLANQREAWLHRERIAQIARRISLDPGAPAVVCEAINNNADLAFDDEFSRLIRDMPAPDPDRVPFSEQIRQQFGEHYANLVVEVLHSAAFIVLLADRREGVKLRRWKTDPEKLRSIRESELRPLRSKMDRSAPMPA